MPAPQNFRSAFNGFNREDVVRYLEYINAKHTAEVNQLTSEADYLRAKMEAFEPQDEVIAAIRRMKRRKALGTVRSVTTDNGCEFLDQERLDRAFRSEVYYTRAYASYEKGAIENCNRLVRRWYPKGTDFNQLTRRQIRQLEDWINSIHRESLNGETAHAYDSRMAKAA